MEYLELGELFKININDETVYLKVEPYSLPNDCENCYFYNDNKHCGKIFSCIGFDRTDDTNVIYKQVNPIQVVYIVFVERLDKSIKRIGIYPTEEDAKKEVEKLDKCYPNFKHYYESEEYFPYGIISDIKEIKL